MKNLYIIAGRSGSGKTSVVQELCSSCGLKPVKTTTTRPRRFPEEDAYHFISQNEFDIRKDIIAPTKMAIGTSWWMELFSSEITAIFDSVHNSGKGDAVIFWEAILGRQIWLRPPRIWSSKRDS